MKRHPDEEAPTGPRKARPDDRLRAVSKRHPEEARSAVSKDARQGAGPVSFEARFRSRLRMTGIHRANERHPEEPAERGRLEG